MKPILQRPLLWLIIIAFCATGCTRIFENDYDAQARRALLDLMAIQDQFHKENKRYAKNLLEIAKYNLEYHNGIVYLEIESAGKDKYRAIALPAESTTARVFAYDTRRGGYYEMDDDDTYLDIRATRAKGMDKVLFEDKITERYWVYYTLKRREWVKEMEGIVAEYKGKDVYIYSGQWGAYWGPNSCGYTDRDKAGIYEAEDAWSRISHCDLEKKVTIIPIK